MSVDAIEALHGVREFLTEKLLVEVPSSLKSDVRAAAKLMDNVLAELNVIYPTLTAECRAMAQVCRDVGEIDAEDDGLRRIVAAAGRLAENLPEASWPLKDLVARHAEWCALIGDLGLALQGIANDAAPTGNRATAAALLSGLVETLGRHASTRSAWQSVFPADKPFSDILIET